MGIQRAFVFVAVLSAGVAAAAGPVDVTGTWSPKYWTLKIALRQSGDRVVGINEGPNKDVYFRGAWSGGQLVLIANRLDAKRKKCEPRGTFVLHSKGNVTSLDTVWLKDDGKVQPGPWTRTTADGGAAFDYPWADELAFCGMLRTYELNFKSGAPELTGSEWPILTALAELMKKDAAMKIEIAGHTDSTGDAKKNQTLSEQRAEAVKKVLVEKLGVDAGRVLTKGHGSEQPLRDNKSDGDRAVNRRVEIVVAR